MKVTLVEYIVEYNLCGEWIDMASIWAYAYTPMPCQDAADKYMDICGIKLIRTNVSKGKYRIARPHGVKSHWILAE